MPMAISTIECRERSTGNHPRDGASLYPLTPLPEFECQWWAKNNQTSSCRVVVKFAGSVDQAPLEASEHQQACPQLHRLLASPLSASSPQFASAFDQEQSQSLALTPPLSLPILVPHEAGTP